MLCGFDPVLTSATTQTGDTDADEDKDDGGEEEYGCRDDCVTVKEDEEEDEDEEDANVDMDMDDAEEAEEGEEEATTASRFAFVVALPPPMARPQSWHRRGSLHAQLPRCFPGGVLTD